MNKGPYQADVKPVRIGSISVVSGCSSLSHRIPSMTPSTDEKRFFVAWNAAYWMLRSEARRQQKARFPDCNWKQVEADDDWVSSVMLAQAELCLAAMQPVAPGSL